MGRGMIVGRRVLSGSRQERVECSCSEVVVRREEQELE